MSTLSTGAAGVSVSFKLPGAFVQVLFGGSSNGAGGATRVVLLLANKTTGAAWQATHAYVVGDWVTNGGNAYRCTVAGTSAGSGGPTGTTSPITDSGVTWVYIGASTLLGTMAVETEEADFFDPTDASAKAGEGCELHLQATGAFKKAPAARIKAIAQAVSTGATATGTVTVATVPTADGTFTLFIHGVQIDTAVYKNDAVNTIAANICAQINAKSSLLNVTASVAAGVVTIMARHSGTRGNLIRLRKVVTDVTATTFTLSAATLTGGTTADTVTNALATALTSRHHYYALASVDTTALQAVQTQILTMAGPLVGKRQSFIAASVDTFGNATTVAETLNEQRGQVLWMPSGETLPCVMAAAWAAMRAIAEGVSISVNLSSYNPDVVDMFPVVVPQGADANYITDSQAAAALDVGLTPVQVRGGDKHPFIPLSITTHSNDSSGNPDYRTLTTNYVVVTDAFADEFQTWVVSTFVDMKLRDDRQSGDDPMPPNVTTPGVIKSMWKSRARDLFENIGHINSLDDDYAAWAFNLVSGNPNRVNATLGITPAPWFTQVSAKILQKTQGF